VDNKSYHWGGCHRIDVSASHESSGERAVLGANILVRTKEWPVPGFVSVVA
jgi:hypothetical protein